MEDFQEYASEEGLYRDRNMQVRRVCIETGIRRDSIEKGVCIKLQ